MITLTSRWKLRAGCPPELVEALETLGRRISEEEPGTLMYLVHVEARPPLDAHDRAKEPPPPPIGPEEQTEVTFIEAYADAEAFARHVNGPAFTWFRTSYLHHFYRDPDRPGWPRTVTTFYRRLVTVRGPEEDDS